MTSKEYKFMLELAGLLDKYQVSIEATDFNDSLTGIHSIQIQNADGDISIDLYGCLYSSDIMAIAKPK